MHFVMGRGPGATLTAGSCSAYVCAAECPVLTVNKSRSERRLRYLTRALERNIGREKTPEKGVVVSAILPDRETNLCQAGRAFAETPISIDLYR